MARKASNSMSSRLTRFETIAGWLYLPFYLIILNLLLQLANEKLSLGMSALTINIAYFVINLAATLLIFHGFCGSRISAARSGISCRRWCWGSRCITRARGFCSSHSRSWPPGFTIYNNETVGSLISDNEYIMMAVTIILAPVIEETLVRGLVFGSIRPTSRVMAYIVSVVLFTLMHNWQYFLLYPAGKVLLSCIPYLPASVALAWTYEKAGTIWAPITLHALINALSFGLLQLNF